MAARFDRLLHTIETNVAGMLKDRGAEKKQEDVDDGDDR